VLWPRAGGPRAMGQRAKWIISTYDFNCVVSGFCPQLRRETKNNDSDNKATTTTTTSINDPFAAEGKYFSIIGLWCLK